MAYEQRDMSGSIFKNREKEKGNAAHERWADYKGEAMIDGVSYWVSVWVKLPEGKTPYMSLAFKPKEARPAQAKKAEVASPRQARKQMSEPIDDDLPEEFF